MDLKWEEALCNKGIEKENSVMDRSEGINP